MPPAKRHDPNRPGNVRPGSIRPASRLSGIVGLFLLLAVLGSSPAEDALAQDARSFPLSERRVAYRIDVKLEPETKRLIGSERIAWTHPGRQPVRELYFHLYPNAFAEGSTFLKESGGMLRRDRMDRSRPGSMEITALRLADGTNLLPALEYVQPDDGNQSDRTLARVALPRPVHPGETLELDVKFRVQLPKVFARMGFHGDFVMAGQWFPKLAAYETAGQRQRPEEGWNAHQYHAHSEFYADFGTYDVTVTVPETYQVAATGVLTALSEPRHGWRHWTFSAADVHDFAWAASPHFLVEQRHYADLGTSGVTVFLYLDPAHQSAKERYFRIVRQAMAKYGEWFGPYPYGTLRIVVPPPRAGGAGGMEYPTLITAWDASVPPDSLAVEQVVVHELAHQYWYGLVASNEFEEPWLDEGLTTYTENKMMNLIFPEYGRLLHMSPILEPQPLSLPAWEYADDTYASNVYLRAARVLSGIEEVVGEEKMLEILRTYFQRYRFAHPSTADFLAVVNEVSGKNFNDFFNRFVFSDGMADYRIVGIDSEPAAASGQYRHRIHLEADNALPQSIPVLIRHVDGKTSTVMWDSRNLSEPLVVEGTAIAWAWLDPAFSNPMEIRHVNNVYRPVGKKTVAAWAAWLGYWLEHLTFWLF